MNIWHAVRSLALFLLTHTDRNTRYVVLRTRPLILLTAVTAIVASTAALLRPSAETGLLCLVLAAPGVVCAGLWFGLLLGGYQGKTLARYSPGGGLSDITVDSTGLDPKLAYLAAPVVGFCGYTAVAVAMIGLSQLALAFSPEAFLFDPVIEGSADGTAADVAWSTISFMFFVEQSKCALVANNAVGHLTLMITVLTRSLMIVLLLPTLLQSVLAIRASRPERP